MSLVKNILGTLSSMYKNCKDRLFNVTTRKKMKIAFDSKGNCTGKFNFSVSSNLFLMGLKR